MTHKHNISNSSNINAIEYDDEANTLYITFKSGIKYMYNNVGIDIYNALLKSPSKGKFVSSVIKKNYTGIKS